MEIFHALPDAAATFTLGLTLSRGMGPGTSVALDGPLGAGKTALAQGIVAGLGHVGPVTSPTFTLVHEYRGGRLPVFHWDFYRLDHEQEVLDLGWDEMLDAQGVILVEWASRFPGLLPPGTWRIQIDAPTHAIRSATVTRP